MSDDPQGDMISARSLPHLDAVNHPSTKTALMLAHHDTPALASGDRAMNSLIYNPRGDTTGRHPEFVAVVLFAGPYRVLLKACGVCLLAVKGSG